MPLALDAASEGSTWSIGRDEHVTLRLPENPTTGFRWEVTLSGSGELAAAGDRFIAGTGDASPGAGGTRVLDYIGRRPGTVQITAVNRRSWDSGPPAQTKAFTIDVR